MREVSFGPVKQERTITIEVHVLTRITLKSNNIKTILPTIIELACAGGSRLADAIYLESSGTFLGVVCLYPSAVREDYRFVIRLVGSGNY